MLTQVCTAILAPTEGMWSLRAYYWEILRNNRYPASVGVHEPTLNVSCQCALLHIHLNIPQSPTLSKSRLEVFRKVRTKLPLQFPPRVGVEALCTATLAAQRGQFRDWPPDPGIEILSKLRALNCFTEVWSHLNYGIPLIHRAYERLIHLYWPTIVG